MYCKNNYRYIGISVLNSSTLPLLLPWQNPVQIEFHQMIIPSSYWQCLLFPTGYTEANVYGSQSTRHHQQRSVHSTHHLHHHAGEQRTFVSNHQLPGARLGRQQHRRQWHHPQDHRRLHGGHAAAWRVHFHARYVGEQNLGSLPYCPELCYNSEFFFFNVFFFCVS